MSKPFSSFSSSVLPSPIRARLERLYANWKQVRLDGRVTVPEFVTFVRDGIFEAMEAVEELTEEGTVKKAVVMEFASLLFDFFAAKIKTTSWIAWLFLLLGDDLLKQQYLNAISLLIELYYKSDFQPE